jgi:hypothetical protein
MQYIGHVGAQALLFRSREQVGAPHWPTHQLTAQLHLHTTNKACVCTVRTKHKVVGSAELEQAK